MKFTMSLRAEFAKTAKILSMLKRNLGSAMSWIVEFQMISGVCFLKENNPKML